MKNRIVPAGLFLIVSALNTQAQDCCSSRISRFESNLGSPEDQCWNNFGIGGVADSGLWRITSFESLNGHTRTPAPFLWTDGHFLETRMQVITGGLGCCGYRAAAFVNGIDSIGATVSILIWDEGVAISTHQNINPGHSYISVAADTTSSLRTYRVESDAAGISLYIDGVLEAQLPYDGTHPTVRNSASWGSDSRLFSGGADTRWEYVKFSEIPQFCTADTNEDGVLSPADFTAWISAFNASCGSCDQNDDGSCTPADFTAWIANYNAGC